MEASRAPMPGAEFHYQEEIFALRHTALHRLSAAGIVIGTVWFLYVGAILESRDLRLWSGPMVLVASGLLARYALSRWGYTVAVCVYVAGAALGVVLGAWAFASASMLLFVALTVGMISLLLGPQIGFLAAAGTLAAPLSLAALVPPLRPLSPVLGLTGILSLLMALLLWVALHPLRTAFDWAWAGYHQSRSQAEALKERRGQLTRALKDLEAAYHRLELMAVELERARRAADESRRLKAEFAASVSHELRTPLNLIIGFSELIALAPHTYGARRLPPALSADVQTIYYNAQHLAKLIDDVLDLSQIEAGRMGLYKEPTVLAEIAAEAVSMVAHLIESKGLSLTVQVAPDLPLIEADRMRIRQVLTNLLSNAARYTERGGVTIRASADERDITVAVADTGVGIAEEELPRAFERFRRLEGAAERQGRGSGLGLAISKEFVELHGGRMWIESRLGEGSTFYFSLPLRKELAIGRLRPEWETWAHMPAGRDGRKAVVVVDRDSAVIRLFQRYLEGYRVLPAADATEARALAEREPIHAVLSMAAPLEPGGLDLMSPGLPVILCALHAEAKAAQPPAVVHYLLKPMTQERILQALQALGEQVRSLLIVDDDPEVVRLLSRMVQMAPRPYQVLKAYGGEQAITLLQKERPGAMLLDLLMPEVDGYAVLSYMEGQGCLRDIPVVVVTAQGHEEEIISAEMVGITQRHRFTIGEMMRYVKANLDAIAAPAESGPASSEASVG